MSELVIMPWRHHFHPIALIVKFAVANEVIEQGLFDQSI